MITDFSHYQLYNPNRYQFYRGCLITLCLSYTLFGAESALAKSGKKAHPVKKVDVNPNPLNEDVWSLTLESNFYQSTVYLNPTVDFSSQNGWDIQIASYNIPAYGGGAQNYEWDSYVNVSKTFDLDKNFKALIGTQNGTTVFSKSRQWHNFDYGLLIYQPVPRLNLHAGPYWANKALSVTTDVIGYTTGFSLELLKNKLSVQGDYFSGNSNVSGAVVNVFYQLLPKAQVYVGVGVPESNSGNEFFGTVGISLASKLI